MLAFATTLGILAPAVAQSSASMVDAHTARAAPNGGSNPIGPSAASRMKHAPPPGVNEATTTAATTTPGFSNYVPLSPFRILDTRSASCVQCRGLALGPGAKRTVQLTGVTGLKIGTDPIPSAATAVVLNVTAVGATSTSVLTVYPYGGTVPLASNLNFGPGTAIANLVTVTLGQGGAIAIYNAKGTVNVLADVEGYFQPEPPSDVAGEFHPIAPVRVCDTRHSSTTPACRAAGAVGQNPLVVNVTGSAVDAIPQKGAEAAVLNLTGVAGSKPTLLSVFPTTPSGTCAYNASHGPPFSTLNLKAGEVRANRVMVQLGPAASGDADTSICVYNAAGTINVLVDANGWFGGGSAASGAQYQAIAPTRICDTRSGSGLPCAGKTLGPGGIDAAVVAGEGGLPATGASSPAVAVIANLTAIAPTASTYVTIYPANQSGHSVSDINLSAGEVVPNLAVVSVDTSGDPRNGDVDLFNAAGKVNALLDVEGWFQLTYTSGISGIVSDTQTPAQPIENATVTYTGTNGTRGSGATTTSGGGAYTLTSVPPGTYTVDAMATGFTSPPPHTVTVTANTVAAINLSLTAGSGIGGGVFDTQTPAQPIVDATVTYSGTAGNTAAGTTTTGSDGSYSFAGVSPGTYVVAGTKDGFTPSSWQTVIVTAGRIASANVTLTATSGINGMVSDTEAPSQPVFGAAVTYTGTGGSTASGSTTTDISGHYAFSGVSPGRYTVDVVDNGYIASSPETVTVGVGGVVSQAFALQGDRDPFLQPFTSTSIWNMPIGSGALYEPANLIPATKQTLVSDQHVIVMTPAAPPMTIVNNPAGAAGASGQRCDTSGAFLTTAPIPADFYVASSTSNLPLVASAADGRTLIQGEPFAHCLGFADGTLDKPLDPVPGDLYGDGGSGWDGGSHLSALGGAIRLGELVPGGAIDHALQIDVDAPNLYYAGSASSCPTWPATVCDSYASTTYTGTNPDLRMGSLLALPASLNLNTLGLETPPAMILAKAFQDYGAYIANDAHRSVNNIVTEYGPTGSVADVVNSTCGVEQGGKFDAAWGYPFETCAPGASAEWAHDIQTIFANLSIVTNNSQGSPGGGGIPIVPLAPPLASPPS